MCTSPAANVNIVLVTIRKVLRPCLEEWCGIARSLPLAASGCSKIREFQQKSTELKHSVIFNRISGSEQEVIYTFFGTITEHQLNSSLQKQRRVEIFTAASRAGSNRESGPN